MNQVTYNSQCVTPSKIVCIGRNYVEHIHELNNEIPEEMVIFNKPNSAITSVLTAFQQEPLHYESEICFLHSQGQLVAIGVGLDLTKRELQSTLKAKGLPWERAKAFDGSAIFSEFVAFNGDFEGLRLECEINGVLIQKGKVEQMIYHPSTMLEYLKEFMTLANYDILMTGTPKGVGLVHSGDLFECRLFRNHELLISTGWLAK